MEHENELKLIWIAVYTDTIKKYDNPNSDISEIYTTEKIARKYFEKYNTYEGISFEQWLDEYYTCDDTIDFYNFVKGNQMIVCIEHR